MMCNNVLQRLPHYDATSYGIWTTVGCLTCPHNREAELVPKGYKVDIRVTYLQGLRAKNGSNGVGTGRVGCPHIIHVIRLGLGCP